MGHQILFASWESHFVSHFCDNPFTQNPCEASVYVASANNTWSCFRFSLLLFRILTKQIHQVFEIFFLMKNYV